MNNRVVNVILLVCTILVAALGDISTLPGGLGDKATKWVAIVIALLTNTVRILQSPPAPAQPPPTPKT